MDIDRSWLWVIKIGVVVTTSLNKTLSKFSECINSFFHEWFFWSIIQFDSILEQNYFQIWSQFCQSQLLLSIHGFPGCIIFGVISIIFRVSSSWADLISIDSQCGFAIRLRELKLGLCDNLEGWEAGRRLQRERTYVYLWLIHTDVW